MNHFQVFKKIILIQYTLGMERCILVNVKCPWKKKHNKKAIYINLTKSEYIKNALFFLTLQSSLYLNAQDKAINLS